MEKVNRNKEFSKLLLESYRNNLIHIEWNKNGYSLKIDEDLDFNDNEKNEFINFTFSVVNIVRKILTNNKISEKDEVKLEIAYEISQHESEYVETINLKEISLLSTFKSFDYNILSHYNKANNEEIKSVVLQFNYEDSSDTNYINIEISKKELNDLINTLNLALSDLESLEKK